MAVMVVVLTPTLPTTLAPSTASPTWSPEKAVADAAVMTLLRHVSFTDETGVGERP